MTTHLDPASPLAVDFEALRRATIEVTGNDGRLDTLRRHRGVIGALEYLMAKPPSAAFDKLMAAKRETAETIIERYAGVFHPQAVVTARERLHAHGRAS